MRRGGGSCRVKFKGGKEKREGLQRRKKEKEKKGSFKVVIFIDMFVCPIITHEPLDWEKSIKCG